MPRGINLGPFVVSVLIFCATPLWALSTSGLSPQYNLTSEPVVCSSVDLRNSVEGFAALENCTVVEGFIQILLFDHAKEAEFARLRFPKLVEITDYLLLYRVSGLRSVGQLFPNLAVIRGQRRAFDYSLIIYEMSNLQEIGLHSLREISAGQVRIDRNPSLCFVHTINWRLIALDRGTHLIRNIRSEDECPYCLEDSAGYNQTCPHNPNLCWNHEHCQIICPARCKTNCDSLGNCCDESCIGCQDGAHRKCLVCRHVSNGGACSEACPPATFKYLDRRCVSKEECVNLPRPLRSEVKSSKPYKILENSCVLECPVGYTENKDSECVKCKAGRCRKECPGAIINSLPSAEKLRGCTHINGSLEIQIRGGKKVIDVLEENLGMIEVIDGYLKIVRSFPLISLAFFKKLSLIRGNVLESNKYAFFVLDNQNLQDIWEWGNHSLRIDRGKLFFHYNPKLCLDKIRTLQVQTQVENFTDLEVASNSNGDKVACNISTLHVVVARATNDTIDLEWDHFGLADYRKLLGYVVYSIIAPHRNMTVFEGRDACGTDGWRVDDVTVGPGAKENYTLTQLKPYQQYAIYVKTYTIASEESGAQSPIIYVRTKSGQPTQPREVMYTSFTDKVHLIWKPPANPNGRISYYIISGVKIDFEHDRYKMQDYCSIKPKPAVLKVIPEVLQPDVKNDTCECAENAPQLKTQKSAPIHTEDDILFEDALFDFAYIKNPKSTNSSSRSRRSPSLLTLEGQLDGEYDDQSEFEYIVNDTEIQIGNLTHFTQYNINIQACREPEPDSDNNICSSFALATVKTGRKDNVDVIESIRISNITEDSAMVNWQAPAHPNGPPESYHIIYGNIDDADPHNQTHCISVGPGFKASYQLRRLKPGNWSIQMSVTTRAGAGKITKVYYFYVERPVKYGLYIFLGFLIAALVSGGLLYKYAYKRIKADDKILITTVNPEYIPTEYVPDEWEVPRENVEMRSELGQGSFGMVYEGLATDINGKSNVRCAIKTVNEHATNRERIEFLNEASVMKAFDTTHVVRLLGVVSKGQPTLVIMELMANGDLKTYLRSHRPDVDGFSASDRKPPNLKVILQMAVEIADGMAYLAAKKFVHRDVAARNCMVTEHLVVKIGDFGMTRDIYETDYYRKGSKGLLPVRWMAPESLKDGVFTSSSDVWSYGVVLWEMATLASQPYQGLTNEQVLRYVIGGNIMERPEKCPDILYDLMKMCWSHKPSERPSFMQLCECLLIEARADFGSASFYHSAAGIEARSEKRVYPAAITTTTMDDAAVPLKNNGNYSENESEQEADDANLNFIHYPSMTNLSATANGYVPANA